MHRLKTRAQFQAALAGGTIARTAHFALHRVVLASESDKLSGPGSLHPVQGPQALFVQPGIWLGAMVPKRWARRAVTRNAIKRQIYSVAPEFEGRLQLAAHVVRLRAGFDRKQFISPSSEVLKQAVRAELQQLFARAVRSSAPLPQAPREAGV
mgnify:CR=1 FL=1